MSHLRKHIFINIYCINPHIVMYLMYLAPLLAPPLALRLGAQTYNLLSFPPDANRRSSNDHFNPHTSYRVIKQRRSNGSLSKIEFDK